MTDILGSIIGGLAGASVATNALEDVANPKKESKDGDIGAVIAGGGFAKLADTLKEGGMEQQQGNSAPTSAQEQQQSLGK